jgi:hypothetical protein
MWRNFKKYRGQPREDRALIREAFYLLMYFRASTLLIHFKYLTRSLTHSAHAVEAPPLNGRSLENAVKIGKFVARVGRHTPWKSPCLTQVLATQQMLAARRIPGVFFLGVHKETETPSQITKLDAHAWLKCGTEIVNGKSGHERFTVVSSWSWQ